MKIDITSLCFGFKIEKENDSGTPAWATSIGQAPKDICYVDTKIEGLSEFVIGMMYKSHSDFENLKVRDVPGLDKKEEPRSNRERMMFSVFEDVFVNGKKVDGIYTLSYEKEHSENHNNRLHICYAKYLTYNDHSNKSTLLKMAELLGCSEDACWFVDDISIKKQSELHFHAIVVNPSHKMTYKTSKHRQDEWEKISKGRYTIIFGPTKYGTATFNYPSLLKKAMQLLVANRNDIFTIPSDENIVVRDNKLSMGGCQVGWDRNSLESVRSDKYDDTFSWTYFEKTYVPNKELTGSGMSGFVELFNKLMDGKYVILSDSDNDNNFVYTIIQYTDSIEVTLPQDQLNFLPAIKTKPFLILGGFSGTGKSRKVKELAFSTCPNDEEMKTKLGNTENSPGNYCLVSVRPNWHDSSDLLGFYSTINDKYMVTDFVRFLVKAMHFPEIPFFVCLDEMNLAPVEYFAEYLSVLESRKKVGNRIVTDPLISPDWFNKTYQDGKYDLFKDLGLSRIDNQQRDLFAQQSVVDANPYERVDIVENLKTYGLCLPQNLIVVGTVNMDDTTNSFSRKVIDRAMTFETIIQNFDDSYYAAVDTLCYGNANNGNFKWILPDEVSAKDALINDADLLDPSVKEEITNFVNEVNNCLKGSPFQISYRILNETILYYRAMSIINKSKPNLSEVIDDILMQKVLPRIEGDFDKVNEPLEELRKKASEKGWNKSFNKIVFMKDRFSNEQGCFTSFWN